MLFKTAVLLLAALPAHAADYIVVPVDTARERLQLFLNDSSGQPYRSFDRLAGAMAQQGQRLVFAMNAGMYQEDGRPVGLLVIDGKQLAPLNRRDASGNFYLKPNGVFALTTSGPRVVTSAAYPRIAKGVRLATQSGPMLVVDGKIHPRFTPDSTSTYVRNGVCARGRTAYFVISRQPVNLYEFARYFRDQLGCRDALYLDGSVSSLYRQVGLGWGLGPILATTQPQAASGTVPMPSNTGLQKR